jgi:sec-independent protein translocase protein TatA
MTTTFIILGILGGQEIIVILIIILLLFGGRKIPELMRGLGKGMNEFKKAKDGIYDEINDLDKEDTKKDTHKEEPRK